MRTTISIDDQIYLMAILRDIDKVKEVESSLSEIGLLDASMITGDIRRAKNHIICGVCVLNLQQNDTLVLKVKGTKSGVTAVFRSVQMVITQI